MRQERNNQITNARFEGRTYTFRSLLEYRWACVLEVLKRGGQIKDWSYEPFSFRFYPPFIPSDLSGKQFGVRKYLVDFKVTELDGSITWHETKGFLGDKDMTKLRCMHTYYPNEKLWLIFQTLPKGKTPQQRNKLERIRRAEQFVQRVYEASHDFKRLGLL